jgi:hypothetical protein
VPSSNNNYDNRTLFGTLDPYFRQNTNNSPINVAPENSVFDFLSGGLFQPDTSLLLQQQLCLSFNNPSSGGWQTYIDRTKSYYQRYIQNQQPNPVHCGLIYNPTSNILSMWLGTSNGPLDVFSGLNYDPSETPQTALTNLNNYYTNLKLITNNPTNPINSPPMDQHSIWCFNLDVCASNIFQLSQDGNCQYNLNQNAIPKWYQCSNYLTSVNNPNKICGYFNLNGITPTGLAVTCDTNGICSNTYSNSGLPNGYVTVTASKIASLNNTAYGIADPAYCPPTDFGSKCFTTNNSNYVQKCLLDDIVNSGCTSNGALYSNINANGSAGLSQLQTNIPSFQQYQSNYTTPLNTNFIGLQQIPASYSFTSDNTNPDNQPRYVNYLNDVMANLNALYYESSNVPASQIIIPGVNNTSLKTWYAATDLCLSNGFYDTYDFCSEYVSTTPSPFLLRCIQKEFRFQGGQIAGKEYPTNVNDQNLYNAAFTRWSDLQAYITELKTRTMNTNTSANDQAEAYMQFYGIPLELVGRETIKKIQGMETFWFQLSAQGTPTVFLGRRIAADFDTITATTPTNVQFISIFNYTNKPNGNLGLKITSPNKVGVYYNTSVPGTINIPQGQTSVAQNSYSFNMSNSVTSQTTTTCWPYFSNYPNFVTVSWGLTTGTPQLKIDALGICSASNVPSIPNQLTYIMTQEPDAPMFSFELFPNITYNQYLLFNTNNLFNFSNDASNVYFGDSRLMNVLPFTNVNKTNSIQYSLDTIGAFNNIFGSAYFNTLSCYSNITSLDSQSWRTITLLVKFPTQAFNSGSGTYNIFQYGPISVSLLVNNPQDASFVFNTTQTIGSGLSNITFMPSVSATGITSNIAYYIMISQDVYNVGQNFSKYTRSLSFYANTLTSASNGYYGTNMKTFTYNTPGNVFNVATSAQYSLVLGSNATNRSACMYVGWLRVFDYVLLQSDITLDMNNTWQRNWWNLQDNLKSLSASGSNTTSFSVLSKYNLTNYV